MNLSELVEPQKEEQLEEEDVSSWNGKKWVQPKLDPELEKQIFKVNLRK